MLCTVAGDGLSYVCCCTVYSRLAGFQRLGKPLVSACHLAIDVAGITGVCHSISLHVGPVIRARLLTLCSQPFSLIYVSPALSFLLNKVEFLQNIPGTEPHLFSLMFQEWDIETFYCETGFFCFPEGLGLLSCQGYRCAPLHPAATFKIWYCPIIVLFQHRFFSGMPLTKGSRSSFLGEPCSPTSISGLCDSYLLHLLSHLEISIAFSAFERQGVNAAPYQAVK